MYVRLTRRLSGRALRRPGPKGAPAGDPLAEVATRKTEFEIAKLDREVKALDRQIEGWSWSRKIEWVKAVGSSSSFFLALVAIGSLWITYQTGRGSAERAEREAVSSLIRELGSDRSQTRSIAALRLGTYLGDPTYSQIALGGLVFAMTLEREPQVQEAILQALKPAGEDSRTPLSRARSRLDSEIPPLFSLIDEQTGRLTPQAAAKIEARQASLVKVTLALAGIAKCDQTGCPPDFGGTISLRGFRFIGYRKALSGANFSTSVLSEADFYKVDLRGAHFDGASLQAASFIGADLRQATFDGAKMQIVNDRKLGQLPRTRFSAADLSGASFVDACLGGADFTGAKNLDLAALTKGYTKGVLIEPEKLAALGTQRDHVRCREIIE